MNSCLEKHVFSHAMVAYPITILAVAISFLFLFAFTDLSYAAASSDNSSSQEIYLQSTKTTSKTTELKGLVEKKSGIYYYKNGKKLKNSWKTVKGKKYYFGEDGKAYTGNRNVDGVRYLFSDEGKLKRAKKSRFVERGKYTFYVTKKGQILTDWQLIDGNLYHFSKFGRMDKDETVGKVKLLADGEAKKSVATRSKIKALKILNKICDSDIKRGKKLKAAWNYLTSRKNFRYRSIYPDQSKKNWQYSTAYSMLTYKGGNCYSFACAFAQMAEVIGYEPYLVLGRVRGSRDGASDGYTRHAWVRINGKFYDPELRFANGYYFYRTSVYPMSTKNVKVRKF